MFVLLKVAVIFWQYPCQFLSDFTIFARVIPDDYYEQVDVGKQLKVRPNAMVADDRLQRAAACCARKMIARLLLLIIMLTRETSELIGPDLHSHLIGLGRHFEHLLQLCCCVISLTSMDCI